MTDILQVTEMNDGGQDTESGVQFGLNQINQQTDSYTVFKSNLKTHLFSDAGISGP